VPPVAARPVRRVTEGFPSPLAERETSFATPDSLQFVVIVEKSYCKLLTNLVEVTTAEGATGVYTETSVILEYCIYLPVFLKDSVIVNDTLNIHN
jgi:hypothetical protein